MSVLETPRIYFRGEVSWDPITTNNYCTFYDENPAEPNLPGAANPVAAFRAQAISAVQTGSWNPHGTHRAKFFDSAVSGADCGGGLVQNDPFVKSPAEFIGMLVDVEPYGAFSSQLFFDAISFGIAGGYRIAAKRNTRFTARYINFTRNPVGAIAGVASVVWQTTFAKGDGLLIDAFDSSALQAMQKKLEDDDVLGLTVQFNAYRTIYYDEPVTSTKLLAPYAAELTKKLAVGGFQPNPARSMMVGVIGLWRKGEPVHEPADRTLLTGPGANPGPPTIVTAHARTTDKAITLDLSNSVSETGLDLKKVDLGELTVVSVDPGSGDATTLATFDYSKYDRDAYERTSGIVTLPISAPATGDLQVRNSGGQVLLAEAALRAIPVVPNLYLNQGDTTTAVFQLYERGAHAGEGIEVAMNSMSASGGTSERTFTLTTGSDGRVSFELNGDCAGIVAYVPVPPNGASPVAGIDPQMNTYMYVRVLPADDEIAQLPPTWTNVYGFVLENWHAMAPCMDNWLNLGNEAQVRSYGPLLKKLTSEAAFENFLYMPVTRDLTPGERTLLYNFLDSEPPAMKTTMVAAEAPVAAAEEAPVNFASLSRKMRR